MDEKTLDRELGKLVGDPGFACFARFHRMAGVEW